MKKLLVWMKGYLYVSIPADHAERFINIMKTQDIHTWCLCIKENRCRFLITRKDYRRLLSVARKTKAYPRIHKKCGGYFRCRELLKHSGLFFGILCFVAFLYIMSRFIWTIDFVGNSLYTEEQLLQYIKSYGVGFGCRVDAVDCSGLEACLRKEFQDISWASAELQGNRLIIRMKENNKKIVSQNSTVNTKIVATQSGVVSAIITRSGTPMVRAGDSVEAGDVLIEGYINTKNEYDEVIDTSITNADGDVWIRSDIFYDDRIPIDYIMKNMTGKTKKGFSLTIFNKKIFSYIPSIPYEKYDIITLSVMWKITDNLYLPISHDTIYCMEYEEAEARHSNTNLSLLSYQRYLHVMEQYLQSGYHIIDEQVELQILDDICQLQGNVTLEGPFWHRVEVFQEETEGNTLE